MNEVSEKLLKRIYEVDTEAGHRFRYHVMRAEACEDYARKICFIKSGALVLAFTWAYTKEGGWYWNEIYNMLKSRGGFRYHIL